MFFADGLNCSIFDREVFQELLDGGLDCVTVSLGFWVRFPRKMVRDSPTVVAEELVDRHNSLIVACLLVLFVLGTELGKELKGGRPGASWTPSPRR